MAEVDSGYFISHTSGNGMSSGATTSPKKQSTSAPCEKSDRCVSGCAAYGRVCPVAARSAANAACSAISKLRDNSQLFSDEEPDLEKLHLDDIEIGGLLGEGGFSLVKSCVIKKKAGVHNIGCREKDANNDNGKGATSNEDGKSSGDEADVDGKGTDGEGADQDTGSFGDAIGKCNEDGDNGEHEKEYAVKFLRRQVMVNKRHFEHGASDIALEANLLSVLDHENIVKIRGITAGDINANFSTGKECGFFIVVDRLYGTLEKKIDAWRGEQDKGSAGLLSRMSSEHKEKRRLAVVERLKIALSISVAMEYLHSKSIVFRDLKPDNIGFDKEGNVKLFDFGLAKELKPHQALQDGRYELTGNTGSRRYMAPEVAKDMPYDHSVDVYSFGILLWELCTAEKPFFGFSSGKHMSLVVLGGERPKMDSSYTGHWPMSLQWLVKRCWSANSDVRPSFTIIKETLEDMLSKENARQVEAVKQEEKKSVGNMLALKWGRRKSMSHVFHAEALPEDQPLPAAPDSRNGLRRSKSTQIDMVPEEEIPKRFSVNVKPGEGGFSKMKSPMGGFLKMKPPEGGFGMMKPDSSKKNKKTRSWGFK